MKNDSREVLNVRRAPSNQSVVGGGQTLHEFLGRQRVSNADDRLEKIVN